MRSEAQQYSSCVKRDVELAPMQMLSRISGAMYHASTSPLAVAAVVAHARALVTVVVGCSPYASSKQRTLTEVSNAFGHTIVYPPMYKRDIAPPMSRPAKRSDTADFFYQQAHILRRERTHHTYA